MTEPPDVAPTVRTETPECESDCTKDGLHCNFKLGSYILHGATLSAVAALITLVLTFVPGLVPRVQAINITEVIENLPTPGAPVTP